MVAEVESGQISARSGAESVVESFLSEQRRSGENGIDTSSSPFSMSAADTDQELKRQMRELEREKTSNDILGTESTALFERVHAAHSRSEKNGMLVRR